MRILQGFENSLHVTTLASFLEVTSRAIKATLLLFSITVLLAGGAAALHGQSADSFDPNADSAVGVVVVQPDGKILIGGAFTTLSPNGGVAVTRNHIARLNPDGTLDTAFDPNANGPFVESIALQADGKILVGGGFTSIGGQMRNNIARLDATTGLADSFNPNPNANSSVFSIVVQPDGNILVGGGFTSIGGQPRNNLARLDATTGAADSFVSNSDRGVLNLALQADGRILACGYFTFIGGGARNSIARLNSNGTLDTTFDALAVDPVPEPGSEKTVVTIAVQADGKILAGGYFLTLGGQMRTRIARLDPATGLADSFQPNVDGYPVLAVAVQTDGNILAGGYNGLSRFDATTGVADLFFPVSHFVLAIAEQADGNILVGGGFDSIGGLMRNNIARIDTTAPGVCVRGPSYWKSHPQAWCVEAIQLGCQLYTQAQAIAIMAHHSGQDKTYSLARRLIAAKLNIACKSSNTTCISSAIATADSFLCAHPVGSGVSPGSSTWHQIKPIYKRIGDYNDGELCAPRCNHHDDNVEDDD